MNIGFLLLCDHSEAVNGKLYLTGHDRPEAYVMESPEAGSVLEWVGTVPLKKSQVVPASGGEPVKAVKDEQGGRPAYQGLAFVFVICTVIWAVSGAGYFWPGWMLIPLGFAVMAHLGNRGKRGH